MSSSASSPALAAPHAALPAWLVPLLATACGLIVANIYYAQPLVGPISAALGLSAQSAGLIVTLTQIGYGLGLLLIVPLGDLVENRRLVLALLGVEIVALAGTAVVARPVPFLAVMTAVGAAAVAVQVIVPYAAHLAPEAARGRVVGNVVSGLMLGIMLARPVASFLTDLSSWHVVFVLSAAVMAGLAVVLRLAMPPRRPTPAHSYGALLASMRHIAARTPVLRRRALYQASLFGAFSLFWTVTPLLLTGPAYRLSQTGVALFALAGVAGAVAAPIAGRAADRGLTRPATAAAMCIAILSFGLTHLAPTGSPLGLALLVAAAVVLDFGVSANLVLGQRAIFELGPELRSRLNGLYMATFFVGGAIGSALGAYAFAHGGWLAASLLGGALPLAALAYFFTEPKAATLH